MLNTVVINHAHMYCGLGGGAKGMNRGRAQVGNLQAQFECIGGIDVDAAAVRDFERLSGVPGTVMDLMDREQYVDFHGHQPPTDWREAVPADILRAYGYRHPHILFLSAPCKGFSGLLSAAKSQSRKYQSLNALTLRGIWLALEAFKDDPIELIVFENVPRIATRGRWLLDQIIGLLRAYGYATAETTHDCGELGGLAQTRKRFLLVARHRELVPNFLYEPIKRPLRAVGDILGRMPLPGDPAAGPMHRIPRLQWKTWVRLAFIEAGKDWRSLNRLAVDEGFLRDYGIVPAGSWRDDILGVLPWENHAMTVTGKGSPTNGRYAVADPRLEGAFRGKYTVTEFGERAGTVLSRSTTAQGCFAVADPRTGYPESSHQNIFRIVPWKDPTKTITGATHVAGSALSVADPRYQGEHHSNVYRVVSFKDNAGTITAGGHPSSGGQAVADPRPVWGKDKLNFLRGHYGVVPWNKPCNTIAGSACFDNGYFSVADPRALMPAPTDNCVARIVAADGTWHRPFTTLELAALQNLIDPEEQLELDGLSDSSWRERIGNAVPPAAAEAIASAMGEVLLLTWAGETFSMSAQPIWVRSAVAALMSAQ